MNFCEVKFLALLVEADEINVGVCFDMYDTQYLISDDQIKRIGDVNAYSTSYYVR